jgi:UDP-N-acetylmuramate dehydrogenase
MDKRSKRYFMKKEIAELKKKFGSKIIFNEKLSKYSWFNLGGPAEIFFRPDDKGELSFFLKEISKHSPRINIVGAGSNTLIRDGGVKGVTIKLSSKFSYVKYLNEDIIEAGGSTLDKKASDFATENSLGGLEFLSCIPGSIGGAVRMNSGCYGQEISKVLMSINTIDFNGNEKEIKNKDLKFSYRECDLPDNIIITSAKFKGEKMSKEIIKNKQMRLIDEKKKSQPSKIKTCGSTFKNTLDQKAWTLIKDSECENMNVGHARVSKKHCNFFINDGRATSLEIEELIDKVRNQVLKKTGIRLDLEIKVIGTN